MHTVTCFLVETLLNANELRVEKQHRGLVTACRVRHTVNTDDNQGSEEIVPMSDLGMLSMRQTI